MKGLVLSVMLFLVMGCSSTSAPSVTPNDPFYAPMVAPVPEAKISADGSIFQPAMANSLYSDVKGRRVGDIITVMLRENTRATKSVGTNSTKESEVGIDPVIGLGGQNVNIGGDSLQLDLKTDNSFTGDASANQSNNLTGDISVTVIQVLPNQNLIVRGEKWLTLNNGDEYIRLTGIIRPADISPSNEVMSSKVANARIQYSGTGSFSDVQKQGWLTKFFGSKWWPL